MLIEFFDKLRQYKVPVTLRELLDLHEAMKGRLIFADQESFYFLSRTILVKDVKFYDRFDQAYADYFEGLSHINWSEFEKEIPKEWLENALKRKLSEEQKMNAKEAKDLESLLEELRKRMEEQKKKHQGGSKWIGTGGTSPFGSYGYNPAGIRVGGDSVHKRAVKVWEKRQFRNLDDNVELGTRNIKVALKRLREFARKGAADELDLDDTIRSTAKNAGYLDIKMIPERHNAVKVLLFFDIGGSMDPFVHQCEELFSAARTEFKHLEFFYFHNCIYEHVWRDNLRRRSEVESTLDVIHKYGRDYKVIIVGDAAMSPYEIQSPGGSVEHWNEEPGGVWLQRVKEQWDKVVWLNPANKHEWDFVQSTSWIRNFFDQHMYPLTLEGLEQSMRYLSS